MIGKNFKIEIMSEILGHTYNKLKLVSIDYLTLIDQEKIPKDILRDSKISDILT